MMDNSFNPAVLTETRRVTATQKRVDPDRMFDALKTMNGTTRTAVALSPELTAALRQNAALSGPAGSPGQFGGAAIDQLEKAPPRRTTTALKAVSDDDDDGSAKEAAGAEKKADGSAKKLLKFFSKKR